MRCWGKFFLNLLLIACVFYSFVVYGGEQGHVSELHNVFFVVEHFDWARRFGLEPLDYISCWFGCSQELFCAGASTFVFMFGVIGSLPLRKFSLDAGELVPLWKMCPILDLMGACFVGIIWFSLAIVACYGFGYCGLSWFCFCNSMVCYSDALVLVMLYESPRRWPGWRFTAGPKFGRRPG